MSYNGKPCEGSCSTKPSDVQHDLENWYEYDFKTERYVCKECGHVLPKGA